MRFFFLAKKLGFTKDVTPSNELISACYFLRINPEEVIINARLALFFCFISFSVFFVLFFKNSFLVFLSVPLSVLFYYYFTESPKVRSRNERLLNLGMAPELITVLGTSLELNPNLERSFKIVSESCAGRIAEDFSLAYRNALINGVSLKDSFSNIINDWGFYSEGFKRGMQLIKSSLSETESRVLTLEKGINAFFNGLINDLRKFLGKTKTHTLILFSFGTIIPLVIISLLPLAGLISINADPLMIACLLILNLLIINSYANYILRNRPATFSEVDVSNNSSNPRKGFIRLGFGGKGFDVPGIPYAVFLFLVISSFSFFYFFSGFIGMHFSIPEEFASFPLIIGFAVSISAYLHGSSHSEFKNREFALSSESELLNVVYSLGTKLEEKRSFEDSLKHLIVNEKGKVIINHLSRAYSSIKDLLVNPEEAIMKELVKTGSRRVVSVFRLIFHALKQGVSNSSRSVFRIYEHFSRMVQAEEDHNSMLEQVLSMMKLTALFFAPIISGFIIIMQELIITNTSGINLGVYGFNLWSGFSLSELILILGFYVLGLTIVLTRYQVVLRNGNDSVLLKHELSFSVLISVFTYLGTVCAGFLF